MKITAEEFVREKIRVKKDIKGSMDALWKYEINGEDALRWAHEFGNIQYNQAIDDAAEKSYIVEVCEECGSRNLGAEDGYKFCRDCNTEINGSSELDKLSILRLKKSVSSTD